MSEPESNAWMSAHYLRETRATSDDKAGAKAEPHDVAFHMVGSDSVSMTNTKCPNCGSTEFAMRNYEMMWHEGDIHCARCEKFIRRFDAG